ncbi:hypothetical protein KBB49_02225 [Candidatus Saccharibacteria bacterium]|jgi:hypothetical protein|nr:hypothetical protein [Candidatus Saccharibacteria bacterium]
MTMTIDTERNLIAFDASKFNYGQITIDSAPISWRVNRYDRDGEIFALEDLEELAGPVVVASLAVNSFANGNYAGRKIIERAHELEVPTAVIAEESMREYLFVFESILFVPRKKGKVSDTLKTWFSTL